jgi:superfamily II DNA or RNA helicase
MRLLLDNIDTTIEGAEGKVAAAMLDWLAARHPRYLFDRRYRTCMCGVPEKGHKGLDHSLRRQWDGYIRFLSGKTHKLATGLVPILCQQLTARQIPFEVVDLRQNRPALNEDGRVYGRTLRPYQSEAIAALLRETIGTAWFPRGVVKLPTGTGKTAAVAGVLALIQGRALVLVHRKTLMHQTAAELGEMLGEAVGIIGDGEYTVQRVTVATVQTLAPLLDINTADTRALFNVAAFVSDESHHLGQAKKTFLRIARKCPAYVRLAVSATPFKKNDLPQAYRLHGATGRLIYSKEPHEIRAMGEQDGQEYLPRIAVNYTEVNAPAHVWKLPYRGEGEEDGAYETCIVRNPVRNAAIVRRVREMVAAGKLSLTLVVREEHGRHLAQELGTEFLYGKDGTARRQDLLGKLGRGEIRCLVASTIADEGLDVPAISHVVLAGAGKDDGTMLQRIGRGARVKTDGSGLEVDDFLDNMNESLWKQSVERYAAVKQAGYETRLLPPVGEGECRDTQSGSRPTGGPSEDDGTATTDS